ncbi:hypothetical protein PG994_014047 [Apiospora phragmitis]|uniref:Uncharacterized protein n=1 Tax=Apiospora phragmitis TaxID=2905665 RepID=A0ABR1T347_9PEZI
MALPINEVVTKTEADAMYTKGDCSVFPMNSNDVLTEAVDDMIREDRPYSRGTGDALRPGLRCLFLGRIHW